ncbi:MAG: nucleotide exchange factor GrpE [Nitrosarchaeum sp.]|nr:nucleotide exchange factor GrpE [Nitrosarchaeum sp.]MBP0119394.1 nucleotide exchange factor GrpE [Nitrosarchaeum sp.]MBP0134627.1 nucleotide exchange factor GrpE [Nitrosarchaeum sp.]
MFKLSEENNTNKILSKKISKNEINNLDDELIKLVPESSTIIQLENLLEKEKQKVKDNEEKIRHVLADYQNLTKKTQSDIEKGVNTKIDDIMLDFLNIYDDFIRAKQVFTESKINTEGLNSILKNMDSILAKYNVTVIDALGEIFNPNFHEAISFITDFELSDNTITKELRKGYISHNRVIRPTLVEISKNENEIK